MRYEAIRDKKLIERIKESQKGNIRNLLILLLCLETPLRPADIVRLNVGDIRDQVSLKTNSIDIKLSEEILSLTKEVSYRAKDDVPLIRTQFGKRNSAKYICKLIRSIGKSLGISLNVTCLKRTFVYWYLKEHPHLENTRGELNYKSIVNMAKFVGLTYKELKKYLDDLLMSESL